MKYIKSKIAGFSICLFVFMLILPFGCGILFMLKIANNFISGNFKTITDILLSLLFISLFLLIINFLKHIRYLQIKDNKLKYWSLFVPWGRTLYFDNYIGKIIETESGSGGSYKVMYLVDKNRKTAFKIMGLHYKNFDEINKAIPLKKIRFSPTTGRYFKLLFTGKIKIKSTDSIPKNRNTERKIRTVIFIAVTISLSLFVVGMIIKILSKIM